MNWIAIILALEIGWQPQASILSYAPPNTVSANGQSYQQFEIEALLFGLIVVGGSARILDWAFKDTINFWPNRLDSHFFAEVRMGLVTAGWRHECSHPVTPYFKKIDLLSTWDGARDELYLRLELRSTP